MRSKKRNNNGLKIFVSILAILVIGILGYDLSIYANVKDSMDTAIRQSKLRTFRTSKYRYGSDSSEVDGESRSDAGALILRELLEAGEPVHSVVGR